MSICRSRAEACLEAAPDRRKRDGRTVGPVCGVPRRHARASGGGSRPRAAGQARRPRARPAWQPPAGPRVRGTCPLRTSLYLELATPPEARAGEVDPESVAVRPAGGGRRGRRAAPAGPALRRGRLGLAAAEAGPLRRPVAGRLRRARQAAEARDPYTVRVSAGPVRGAGPPTDAGTWSFTTEAAPAVHALNFPLDLKAEPVRWHGRFFSGICNVIFCTQAENYGPTYELMAEARKEHPRAWSYQRDFWPTGTEYRPAGFLPQRLPNIVRERETRRIAAIEPREGGLVLRVEDVFGHEQYGIPAGPTRGRGLPPGRRGPHRRRRPRCPHQGPRGRRRGRHRQRRPRRGPRRRLEDRLRRAAPPEGRPRLRRGCSRPAAATSASSTPTARRAITGGGSTRSGTWPTASTAAA